MVHVRYRGAPPALSDLISGRVQVMFPDMPSSIEYIKVGKLRALAVTAATRSELLPDVPTIGDFVPLKRKAARPRRRAQEWRNRSGPPGTTGVHRQAALGGPATQGTRHKQIDATTRARPCCRRCVPNKEARKTGDI
jgi:hypothetical protein